MWEIAPNYLISVPAQTQVLAVLVHFTTPKVPKGRARAQRPRSWHGPPPFDSLASENHPCLQVREAESRSAALPASKAAENKQLQGFNSHEHTAIGLDL